MQTQCQSKGLHWREWEPVIHDPNLIVEKDAQRLVGLEQIEKKQELTHDMIKTCQKRIVLAKLVIDFRQAKIANWVGRARFFIDSSALTVVI